MRGYLGLMVRAGVDLAARGEGSMGILGLIGLASLAGASSWLALRNGSMLILAGALAWGLWIRPALDAWHRWRRRGKPSK